MKNFKARRNYKNIHSMPVVLILIIVSACSSASVERIEVGDYKLCVPSNNIDIYTGSDKGEQLNDGFDTGGPQVVFTWRPEVVEKGVVGYQKKYGGSIMFISTLKVSAYAPGKERMDFLLGPESVEHALNLTNSFDNAVVVHDETENYFRVSRKIEYPSKWVVITMKPGRDVKVPERKDQFWLGDCFNSSTGMKGCYLDREYNGLYLNISFGGDNFHLREKIVSFVTNQIEVWRNACELNT